MMNPTVEALLVLQERNVRAAALPAEREVRQEKFEALWARTRQTEAEEKAKQERAELKRQANVTAQLGGAKKKQAGVEAAVDESTLSRYRRILKSKMMWPWCRSSTEPAADAT